MKEFWTTIQVVIAGIGGWLGWFLEDVTACFMRFWLS